MALNKFLIIALSLSLSAHICEMGYVRVVWQICERVNLQHLAHGLAQSKCPGDAGFKKPVHRPETCPGTVSRESTVLARGVKPCSVGWLAAFTATGDEQGSQPLPLALGKSLLLSLQIHHLKSKKTGSLSSSDKWKTFAEWSPVDWVCPEGTDYGLFILMCAAPGICSQRKSVEGMNLQNNTHLGVCIPHT